MKTSGIIADKLKDSELVLNIDGGGGVLNETTNQPEYFTWQGAEKTYADFQLTVTNPGGHSSRPGKVNAIDELAAALLRIQAYQFKPEPERPDAGRFRRRAPGMRGIRPSARPCARLRRRSDRRGGHRHCSAPAGAMVGQDRGAPPAWPPCSAPAMP